MNRGFRPATSLASRCTKNASSSITLLGEEPKNAAKLSPDVSGVCIVLGIGLAVPKPEPTGLNRQAPQSVRDDRRQQDLDPSPGLGAVEPQVIGGFKSVGREFHCSDGGEPGIAHDQKEGSQILVIATRLEDCRHLHFREGYNGRLIVINGRSQGYRGILRDPFHVYGKFEEALQAFGLLEACRLRHSPTLTKLDRKSTRLNSSHLGI